MPESSVAGLPHTSNKHWRGELVRPCLLIDVQMHGDDASTDVISISDLPPIARRAHSRNLCHSHAGQTRRSCSRQRIKPAKSLALCDTLVKWQCRGALSSEPFLPVKNVELPTKVGLRCQTLF